MSDQEMESNFDVGGRQISSVDMEGYSLLPDIIWTPGPDMLNSQFGKVIFTNVREFYPTNEDLLCTYTIMAGVEVREGDKVAIFCVGWANIDQVITWVLAAKHPWPNEELSVVFPASQLPPPGTNFYQFCYISAGEVKGASVPFNFVYKTTVNTEEQQKALYFRNHAFFTSPAQINIVSTGGGHLQTMTVGDPQNLALSSTECRNITYPGPSSDEPLRANSEASGSSSCEVSSSGIYLPFMQSEQQRSMGSIPLRSIYVDHAMPTVVSTPPAGYNGNEELLRAQLQSLSPELRRRFAEIEREKQALLRTVTAVGEENYRLKGHLAFEIQKNKTLMDTLHKSEVEIDRQNKRYDSNCRNNLVVITELENELDNHKMRIDELKETISEKDKTIAYYSHRYGAVNEHVIALGGLALFPVFPGQPGFNDGQGEHQRHVDIGASSDMQRQYVRASRLPPFLAALRKTRNYFVTFLTDKNEIQRKVFALSCMKLSLVRKLHSMKLKKESLLGLQYQHNNSLARLSEKEAVEIRRIFEELSKLVAEKADIDREGFIEADVIEEIKNRLKINKKNIYTVRAKALDVFKDFLRMYNSSSERNMGALLAQEQAQRQNCQTIATTTPTSTMSLNLTPAQAKAEVEHIQTLFTGLDNKFENILVRIDKCVNNTFIWD